MKATRAFWDKKPSNLYTALPVYNENFDEGRKEVAIVRLDRKWLDVYANKLVRIIQARQRTKERIMSNLIEDNVVKVYSIPAGIQASNESGHPIANAMYVAEQNAKGEAGYFFSFSSSAWSANTVQADMKLALD